MARELHEIVSFRSFRLRSSSSNTTCGIKILAVLQCLRSLQHLLGGVALHDEELCGVFHADGFAHEGFLPCQIRVALDQQVDVVVAGQAQPSGYRGCSNQCQAQPGAPMRECCLPAAQPARGANVGPARLPWRIH